MNTRIAKLLPAVGLALLAACAPFNVLLKVPSGSPEDTNACGPTTGEMVMKGYPSPPSPPGGCVKPQNDVFLAIQAAKLESFWDTDPAGMRAALTALCPPPGGSWVIFHDADGPRVMHSVAYYMTHNRYPIAALLNTAGHPFSSHQEHWVTVKGIGTDADPTTNTTVTLEYVWFSDPAVEVGKPAVDRYVAASTWYTEFQPVSKTGSAYLGQFVAIIEPPQKRGRATAPAEVVTGTVVSEWDALKAAARWVRKLDLDRLGPYREIARSRPLPPILVDSARGGYYLVPYSLDGKTARFAVLVNAYTGGFQEIGAFAPIRFLAAREAQELALAALPAGKPGSVRAEALSSPAAGASRYQPVWRVWVDGRPVDVTQQGAVLPNRPPERARPEAPR